MKLAMILGAASRLVDGLLVLLVAIVLGCVALTTIGPRLEHPVVVIEGGSMQPALPLGALALLEGGVPGELRIGDVVTFRTGNGTLVTHRIVQLVDLDATPYIRTKGDANADPDPVLTARSAIVGRVAWTLPGAGYVARLLATPAGVLAMFLMAVTLVFFGLLLDELAQRCRHGIRQRARRRPMGLAAERTERGS